MHRRSKLLTLAVVLVAALAAAGCSGRTTGSVAGPNKAVLYAEGSCDTKCGFYFIYTIDPKRAIAGKTPTQTVGRIGTTPFHVTVGGLKSNTTYYFRVCGFESGDPVACVGPDGTGNTWGKFRTT